MNHYIRLKYNVPLDVYRYQAIDSIERYIYSELDEFQCLPRDDKVDEFINSCFGKDDHQKDVYLMVRLTDEQAMKTAADRSEFKHADPVKIKKEERKALRKISKRKRSTSEEDDFVHKKIKDCRCPICLEDMESKKNITLDCDCVFHYTCIKKWLGCKKVCPTCEKSIDI